MKNNKALNLAITVIVAGAVFFLGSSLRSGETSDDAATTEDTISVESAYERPEGLLDGSATEVSTPEPTEEEALEEIVEGLDPTNQEPATSQAPTTPTTRPDEADGAPEDTSVDAPTGTTAPVDDEERVYGAGFPDKSPFAFRGWEEIYYMPENTVQAGLYGLDPKQVRSWVYFNNPGSDLAEEYQKIAGAITAAGGKIGVNSMAALPADGTGKINGRWEGFTFVVLVTNWDSITFSLLDR